MHVFVGQWVGVWRSLLLHSFMHLVENDILFCIVYN